MVGLVGWYGNAAVELFCRNFQNTEFYTRVLNPAKGYSQRRTRLIQNPSLESNGNLCCYCTIIQPERGADTTEL